MPTIVNNLKISSCLNFLSMFQIFSRKFNCVTNNVPIITFLYLIFSFNQYANSHSLGRFSSQIKITLQIPHV